MCVNYLESVLQRIVSEGTLDQNIVVGRQQLDYPLRFWAIPLEFRHQLLQLQLLVVILFYFLFQELVASERIESARKEIDSADRQLGKEAQPA